MNESLARVYREHWQGLYVLALAITRSSMEAEDAIHDAFARMMRATNDRMDTTAYAFAAVRNAAIDRVRRRQADATGDLSLAACIEQSGASLELRERDCAIASEVDHLPDDLRWTLILRVYGGLNFRQIGQTLGLPLQTAVSRYAAALERLRSPLRKWL